MSRFVPTPEQREILEHQGPMLVLAGAGVGKTAVLIQRIANAIEQDGVPPEQILALTFTRAAAQEMRQRIAAELTERQSDASPDAIWAGTYHAFAGEIVRGFGVRLGIAPNARLLSDAGKWALLDQIFDRLRFVKKAQAVGFTLGETASIIAEAKQGKRPCAEVRRMAEERLAPWTSSSANSNAIAAS